MSHQQSFNHSSTWYESYENNFNDSNMIGSNSAVGYGNSSDYNVQNCQHPYQSQTNNLRHQNSNQFLSSSWPSSNFSTKLSISRSNSNERFSPSNESRRGRPLMPDSIQEPEKIKEKRSYARKYREMVRTEKTKLKEENDQLRHLIQRFLYLHSILPQNVEVEIQRLKNEFHDLIGTEKLKNSNIFTFP